MPAAYLSKRTTLPLLFRYTNTSSVLNTFKWYCAIYYLLMDLMIDSYIYFSNLNLLTMTVITSCWEIIIEMGQICVRVFLII